MSLLLVLIVSIALRLMAISWAVLVFRRIREPWLLFLAALLGVAAGRQMLVLATAVAASGWSLPVGHQMDEVPGLLVSIMALVVTVRFGRFLQEKEQATTQLAEREARLRMVTEQMPAILWTADTDLIVVSLTGVGREALGVGPEELIGRPTTEILGATVPENPIVAAQRRTLLGESVGYEVEFRGKIYQGYVEPLRSEERIVGTIGIALDISERKQQESALAAHRQRLRELAAELSLAEERERRRIAADLHDGPVQSLGLAHIKLAQLKDVLEQRDAAPLLDELIELTDTTIDQTNSLLYDLSPPILYELGFEPAVEWLAERFDRDAGIVCSLTNDDQPKPLEQDDAVLLFQVVRELLVNVRKHSGARHVRIELARRGDRFAVCVIDDGAGFDDQRAVLANGEAVARRRDRLDADGDERMDASQVRRDEPLQVAGSGGFGLFSIRERLDRISGDLTIDSSRDDGTRTTVTVPLGAADLARSTSPTRGAGGKQ